MFLKLLTTQMQNQDPLSPMDTSQYTQQLVQYSQVEQSIQQNSTLKDILSSLDHAGHGAVVQHSSDARRSSTATCRPLSDHRACAMGVQH